MAKRTIVMHCHIFKNAGSTIDEMLKLNFKNHASFIESIDGNFVPNEKIITTCLCDENIISLSSHKIKVTPPLHSGLHFITLVMVRNPLDRLGSIYNFYRDQTTVSRKHQYKIAQRVSFKDFVQVFIESGNDSFFANSQTQFFLGQGLGLSEETWPMAAMNFQKANCVGVVEKFDESMRLWAKYLAQYFTGLNFSHQKKNVSKNRPMTLVARLSVLEEALGEELLDIFYERNRYDYQLYRLALDRIHREIGALDDCSADIATSCSFKKILSAPEEGQSVDWHLNSSKVVDGDLCPSDLGPPLCLDKDGGQVIIPRICRNKEILEQGARLIGCGLFDTNDQPVYIAKQGQTVIVILVVESFRTFDNLIAGISVRDHLEKIIFEMNSNFSADKVGEISENSTIFYTFQFVMPPLNQGTYSIAPAIALGTQENHHILDVVEDAVIFFVSAMINPRLPGVLYLQDFKFSASIAKSSA